MGEGSFPLAKSNSNSEEVTDMFFREFGDKHSESESVKILGLKWLKLLDSFAFEGTDIPGSIVITKRVVLSLLARLFDTLGFLNPYTMYVKILLQDIWLLNLDWDEETPRHIRDRFMKWVKGLQCIQSWRIPRCYTTLPWAGIEPGDMELYSFGDASEKGYGAVVYIRVAKSDGTFDVALVASRARVAPLKKVWFLTVSWITRCCQEGFITSSHCILHTGVGQTLL
jgi:hypothetical protein